MILWLILLWGQYAYLTASSDKERAVYHQPVGCTYEGHPVDHGTPVWKDPDCECTQLVCLNGLVELVKKDKPCCKAPRAGIIDIFGNGETIKSSTCSDLVCKDGRPITKPRCPDHFMPVTYKGCVGCYNVSTYKMKFDEAQAYCERFGVGARPVEITSEEEDKALEWYLLKLMKEDKGMFWTGGLTSVATPPSTDIPDMDMDPYLYPFSWPSITKKLGIYYPVEAIYDDWCPDQPSSDIELTVLQLGWHDSGHYCWCNRNPDKLNYVICETCTHEKLYQNNCIYEGEIIHHSELITKYTKDPGPCYEVYCKNGRYDKYEIPCKSPVTASPPRPPNVRK